MGLFDDLTAPPPAQRRAPGMFDDLAAPQRAAPPPLLQRPPARPGPLKRAAVNAEAAFYGADGDTAGLGSEALIWTAAGRDRRQAAVGNRGLANLLGSVGLDSVAGYLNSTANEQDAEAAAKAAAFERAQQQRRQAVTNLGPAQGFGEKAADLGGRLAASIPQPENFVGGPVLKGATLPVKIIRAGTGAALANIATEPVLQASAVGRGTRDEVSAKDAAVNTLVAFGTGGLFGAGAHGIEKLRGRGKPAEPAAGIFDDLAQPAAAPDGSAPAGGIFDDLAQPPPAARAASNDGAYRGIPMSRAEQVWLEHTNTQPDRTNPAAYDAWIAENQRLQAEAEAVAGLPRANDNLTPEQQAGAALEQQARLRDLDRQVDDRLNEKAAGSAPVGETPPFAPNSPPPVQPSDGGIFGDLRGLATEGTVEQALGDLVKPDDVMPLRGPRPSVVDNRVSSLAEADRANPPTAERLAAPDERDAFQTRRLASRSDPNRAQFRKEPMDLVTWARRQGGLRESGGELIHMGLDNKPRAIEFARNEHFLGKLVDNENGLDLDEAAQRAWEEGYFPDLNERPDIETFMVALGSTHRGDNRVFHPRDWEALADYRSRLGDRMRIEQAGREGAPATVIRGEPVTPDDLDARALPVGAYQADLPARELAGNIRTDLLDSPQSIDRALREVAAKAGGFREARRGIQRQDQTRELAAELGMTVEQLLKRRPGQALNAEQALAARQILAKSANELVALARRAKGGTDEDLAGFRTALLRHAAIQEQVSGATAEAGRALSQFRMTANSRDVMGGPVIRGEVVRSIVDGAGGRDHLEDVAQKLLEQGSDPAKINKVAQAAAKPGGREKFMELYINSLLSGPQTHAVNILSNAITAIGQVPETLGAAAIGGVRRTLGSADPDRVLFSEAGARAVGLVQGAREGLRLGKRAFKTGEPSDMVGAIENSQYRAISGRKGELIRLPTRALTAEDEFFKAIARRMELNAVAVRKAGAMGLKGQARRDKVAELVANPTDEMFEQAKEYARYLTFQRKLGPLGQRMLATTNTPTTGGAAWKWLFPFLRTPINLVKFAAERSPLAPAMKEWRTDYAAGGARRDIALARFTFGTGVAALIGTWAAEGTITGGGPADPEERALLMADGWRPYSVRLDGTYYSYDRLDPLATVMGTVADVVERANDSKEADAAEVGTAVIASILSNLGGGIFLDTMGDLTQAVDNPSMADKFIASQAGKLVPAIVGQVSQVADPVLREAKEPLDRIRSRVPGLSSGLLPKRDIWGEPIKRPSRLGLDIASPLPVGKALNDPINRELMRLGVQIGRPQRKIGAFQLNAVEYDAYQETAGKLARQYIQEEMRNDWQRMPAADQIETVKTAVKDAREDARDKLRERFPHLQEADDY